MAIFATKELKTPALLPSGIFATHLIFPESFARCYLAKLSADGDIEHISVRDAGLENYDNAVYLGRVENHPKAWDFVSNYENFQFMGNNLPYHIYMGKNTYSLKTDTVQIEQKAPFFCV